MDDKGRVIGPIIAVVFCAIAYASAWLIGLALAIAVVYVLLG
jgi:hypothetical protein